MKQSLTQRILIMMNQQPVTSIDLGESLDAARGSINSTLSRLQRNKVIAPIGTKHNGKKNIIVFEIANQCMADHIIAGNRYLPDVKTCAYCGDEFRRRDDEYPSAFKARQCCSELHSRLARRGKKKQKKIVDIKVKPHKVEDGFDVSLAMRFVRMHYSPNYKTQLAMRSMRRRLNQATIKAAS